MQFEFRDQFFKILMEALELTVSQFRDFRPSRLLVSHLQNIDNLPTGLRLVVDYLGL